MIDAGMAAKARTLVESAREDGPKHERETAYRSLCESMPILLRTSGLTRTVAFLDAKKKNGDNEYGKLLNHLATHFADIGVLTQEEVSQIGLSDLLTRKGLMLKNYRHYSMVAQRAAQWHKRLAQALLRQKERQ